MPNDPHACAHCGLPVPPGLIDPDAERQFCCRGCESVYALLHTCGLQSYYQLRDDNTQPARTTGRDYRWMDEPTFTELHVQSRPDGLQQTEMLLEGVHCAACVWLVEKLPNVVDGLLEARLNLAQAIVQLTWDPQRVKLSRIAERLDAFGYPPHPARGGDKRRLRRQENRRYLARIAVAGACAGNVMLLAFALYAGWFSGMAASDVLLFRVASLVIAAIALLGPGMIFFRGAWNALRLRTANLDLPIAVALSLGGIAGAVNTVLQRGEVYFDSLTVLVFLLLVGRFLQHLQQRRAADSVELLFSLTPTSARVVDGDVVRDVPVEALEPGQVVEVHAGETVPVDGLVSDGRSTLDLSLLTGESRPQDAGVGDAVCAGTVNLSSTLRVAVRTCGRDTRIGKLMQLIEQSTRHKSPTVNLADRVAGWFTLVVITCATATAAAWWWIDPAHAIDHAVALLIVACPCALGLATPLAFAATIGRSAQRGILVKGASALEHLAKPGTILLDKTGTLTVGRTRVLRWVGDESIKPTVLAIESQVAHHAARAIAAALVEQGVEPSSEPVTVAQSHDGGVMAGAMVIGSPRFVPHDAHWRTLIDEAVAHHATPVLVACDGQVRALIELGDDVRPEARDAVAALRRRGWSVHLLSGDQSAIARYVAGQVGIDAALVRGEVTPEQKAMCVKDETLARPVVMVGDGVNDAAALAAADVGIAVDGGAEASIEAADVYLHRAGLRPLVELVAAARRTRRVILSSLGFSLVYNAGALTLAAVGWIGPLVAAVLMPISSLAVLSIVLMGRSFEPVEE